MAFRQTIRKVFLIAMVLALVLSACSKEEVAEDETGPEIIDQSEPTPIFDHNATSLLSGISIDPLELEPGDCFNHYVYRDAADFLQQVTSIINCDEPHHREVYYKTAYPSPVGEPYPREEILKQWAEQRCLDEFEDFVGIEYVLSLLDLGVSIPTFSNWTDNDDRTVICFVFPDKGGRLTASAEGSGI